MLRLENQIHAFAAAGAGREAEQVILTIRAGVLLEEAENLIAQFCR